MYTQSRSPSPVDTVAALASMGQGQFNQNINVNRTYIAVRIVEDVNRGPDRRNNGNLGTGVKKIEDK